MGYADEYLKDTGLTEESVLRDLEILAAYYGDMELEGRVLPAREEFPMPTSTLSITERFENRRMF